MNWPNNTIIFISILPVLKEEDTGLLHFRLCLSHFTASIIQKAMFLLGIEVPERM